MKSTGGRGERDLGQPCTVWDRRLRLRDSGQPGLKRGSLLLGPPYTACLCAVCPIIGTGDSL